jgi:hypothetical protein
MTDQPTPPGELCTCERCQDERCHADGQPFRILGPNVPGWSYACGTCGNKRCPHHADHRFVCTRSNEPGQIGVLATDAALESLAEADADLVMTERAGDAALAVKVTRLTDEVARWKLILGDVLDDPGSPTVLGDARAALAAASPPELDESRRDKDSAPAISDEAAEAFFRVWYPAWVTFSDEWRSKICKSVRAALTAAAPHVCAAKDAESFQTRVLPWLIACFGTEIASDKIERNHRFLEEALETVQAAGCTQSEAHQLVDYVYGRPVGELSQEVGGVMVTLAALCLAHGVNMHDCGETELARVWTKVEKIRSKQAAKPKHSPLPEQPADAKDAEITRLKAHIASIDTECAAWRAKADESYRRGVEGAAEICREFDECGLPDGETYEHSVLSLLEKSGLTLTEGQQIIANTLNGLKARALKGDGE